MPATYSSLPNLASERLGAAAVACNDEFFAPMGNLVRDAAPVFEPDRYTDQGKWMDGWETRRRREPGHDWCVVRLGLPGLIRHVVVDTAHFTGNYPEAASVEAGDFATDDEAGAAGSSGWVTVVAKVGLEGGTANRFEASAAPRATHVRLNVFPDGGVARLRAHGEVVPDWAELAGREADLAAVEHGGAVTGCSDWYFCEPANLLLPGSPRTMGDGWETRRRRGPGNDWVEVRLGVGGMLRSVIVDTSRFKGNAPGWVSLAARRAGGEWERLVDRAPVEPDTANEFADLDPAGPFDELRLDIHPDGGVARLRVLGVADHAALAAAGTSRLNALATRRAHRELLRCCGSGRWAEQVAAARPYQDFDELLATAEQIWWDLDPDDWLQAFRAHPRIGDRVAEGGWPGDEQSGVAAAAAAVRRRLEEANAEYERRFGHIFIVFATGKEPAEMLELLAMRLENEPEEEIEVAAAEQAKITRLRLHKLMGVTPAAIRAGRPD